MKRPGTHNIVGQKPFVRERAVVGGAACRQPNAKSILAGRQVQHSALVEADTLPFEQRLLRPNSQLNRILPVHPNILIIDDRDDAARLVEVLQRLKLVVPVNPLARSMKRAW